MDTALRHTVSAISCPGIIEASEVEYDPEGAAALLDEAGWIMNDDGVREKDGVQAELNLLYRCRRFCAPGAGRGFCQSVRRAWNFHVQLKAWDGIRRMTGLCPNP